MPCLKRKPHDWLFPLPSDAALECARCGRLMERHEIQGFMRKSVISSAHNRLGPKHGPRFQVALEAMLALPRVDIDRLKVTRNREPVSC